jgi:hypothetical protein
MLEARQAVTTLREERLKEIDKRLAESPYRFDGSLAKLRVIRRVAEGLVEQDGLELSTNITSSLPGQIHDIAGRAAEIEVARATSVEAAAEIEALLTQVRGAAGAAVAKSLSGYYATSAGEYSKRAFRFLLAMIASIIGLAALAIYAFLINPPPVHSGDNTTETFIRSLVIRLLFLGIAGTAVPFTSRNYRVSKHLQVVNEAKTERT